MNSIITMTAGDLLAELTSGHVTTLDVLDALEARIGEVDGSVNALPTLCFDRARDRAKELMDRPLAERGMLCGLPVAIKDLDDVEGVPTTHGSPIFANNVPTASAPMVQALERNGGLVYAKTNTPEFGAGANTFNEVFGATLNPWDLKLSAAGSSGGSAAALVTGMAWLAQGSDMGGSLRNPASFCGVVGMRPSPGRVPRGPSADAYGTLGVLGPMARCVDDLALFMDAMSELDPTDPLSMEPPAVSFRRTARETPLPRRIAFSADLGITPVDPEVAEICKTAAQRFEVMGVMVEEAHPDLGDAHRVFRILRAESYAQSFRPLLEAHADKLKPEVVGNIEQGLALSTTDLAWARAARGEMVLRAASFFDSYDVLLTPATIVSPYPVEQRYVKSCNGQVFDSYIDWLAIAYAITLVSLPALSLPCGYTKTGLPVGLQMVTGARGEGRLLGAARHLEQELNLGVSPIDPRPLAVPGGR